ncbi:benzoate 4-monooxygenase cytochrome p450 [Colletotrichum karsti]|uniref:Benzoate 4-monooxygenase cytochrome p450 n=1 Tax=Colletotrichum karsti TaxID=1095194 RepID=A0A9P6I3B6_9PEZI|nr:benzoate 4-monooxygenase cytochrome p450 [Colletotrichum karsti]KAF9876162.1 benzoate 4-monooxygenase cytochrome p450 [Colletotrichum karsti]
MAVISSEHDSGSSLAHALVCALIWSLWTVVYNLYFHPLARFPGPILARVSPIPYVIALVRGRIPFWVKACHDQYGPIVRVSPNELSFDNEVAWKDIYGSRPGHKNFHKDPIHVGSIQSVPGVSTITMANDADHARQRRALSHAFSTKALLEQEYIVKSYIDVFSRKMQEFAKLGKPVNVVDWFAYTTFDIIGDMALGEPFGCLTNEDFHFWVPMISSSIKAGAFEQATRRLAEADGFMQKQLLKLIPQRIRTTRIQHLEYSREKILKRMAQSSSDHKDFLYYLLKQQESGSINQNEVIVNGALFIIAGTETTAGFLAGLFNQLLRHPRVLNKLTEEIRSNFSSDADINFEDLVKLPYLSAVIDEGLRIFPSAPIGFVRTVPQGGDTVDGEFIPEGTTVSVPMWGATHSERNFKDPYTFLPERWLNREGSSDKFGASNAFSLGPRGCIGRNLSYMEMRLIIGKLLWHNDLQFHGDNDAWDPEKDYPGLTVYNNWMKPGLWVKLTPRSG